MIYLAVCGGLIGVAVVVCAVILNLRDALGQAVGRGLNW